MEPPPEESSVDYFYLHETPILRYMVDARPPPADTSIAEFRIQFPTGKLVHTERGLKRDGQGTIPFDRKKHNVGIMESPIFCRFVFTKGKVVREHLVVVSLAEPAVGAIEGPVEVKKGEKIALRVTQWDALAWDMPGLASLLREKDWKRLPPDAPPNVCWWLDGEKLKLKGSTIEFPVQDEHEGKTLQVMAYLGEKLPKKALPKRANVSATRQPWADPARTQIVCPKLTIEGPKQLLVGDDVTYKARIEPEIPGKFRWTVGAERLVVEAPKVAKEGEAVAVLALAAAPKLTASGKKTKKKGGGKKAKKGDSDKDEKKDAPPRDDPPKELHADGPTLGVTGTKKSAVRDDTPISCKFISDLTGKEYEARIDATVTKGVKATVPIVLKLPPTDDAGAWLRRNPVEVEIDGFVVDSGAVVSDDDPNRVLVQFRIGDGEHSLLVTSAGRAQPGARQPPRIVYVSQKVKVTEELGVPAPASASPAPEPAPASAPMQGLPTGNQVLPDLGFKLPF